MCGKKLDYDNAREVWGIHSQHALAGNIEENMIFAACSDCETPIESLDIKIVMYTGLTKTRWEARIPNRDKLDAIYAAMAIAFDQKWEQGKKHRERADETEPEPEMMPEPEPPTFPIICLCGSTRFKSEFERLTREFTLQGFLVLSVVFYVHDQSDPDYARITQKKGMLDQIHLQKIRMSNGIYVINKGGYIGESTRREIEYAKSLGKTVQYMEEPP